MRHLARTDLYFLIRYVIGRQDLERQWLFDRCREVQAEPYGYLDLWAREHYKSTIITYGSTIQEILASHGEGSLYDEVTVGIFSHTNTIAKAFLRQIKRTLEDSQLLKDLFPDILYQRPEREASMWSEQGIIVKRRLNPKEATVAAHGLVDGMPTGVHYNRMVYDDVVSQASVSTPEQSAKTTEAWELSGFLGTENGKKRYIGTRWDYNDTYRVIMQRHAATPRIYPATDDGSLEGKPVLVSERRWEEIVREYGPFVTACQMLQDPSADRAQGLQREWLNYWDAASWAGMNTYLLVDPASEKAKKSDWTAIALIGIGPDGNKYWIDGVRDRLNMKERSDAIFAFHRKYKPRAVGYEKYGHQTDIEYMEREMGLVNYRFQITALGGSMGKNDRIRRMVPDLAEGRWYWPQAIYKTLWDGTQVDIVEQTLLEEYDPFPVPIHDDMLDCMSRIYDADFHVIAPRQIEPEEDRYTRAAQKGRRRSPMSR